MLAGLVLLGQAAGGYEMSQVLASGEALRQHSLYMPILLLVLAGAFTKSAQFPFHFWLPGAMAAPTPVSAYLHSATMVKAGVYLMARLTPALGGSDAWHYIVTLAGAATMLAGAVLAFPQKDLKKLLAYSTVSALGTLTLLIGLDTSPFHEGGHGLSARPLALQGRLVPDGGQHRSRFGHAGCEQARRTGPADALDLGCRGAFRTFDGRAPAPVRVHQQGASIRGKAAGAHRGGFDHDRRHRGQRDPGRAGRHSDRRPGPRKTATDLPALRARFRSPCWPGPAC